MTCTYLYHVYVCHVLVVFSMVRLYIYIRAYIYIYIIILINVDVLLVPGPWMFWLPMLAFESSVIEATLVEAHQC